MALDSLKTVQVTLDDGIAWVELNRPEKRNAMSPHAEQRDDRGAGGARCRRDLRRGGADRRRRVVLGRDGPQGVLPRGRRRARAACSGSVRRDSAEWQWRLLRTYAKPTIAMVNGWCFGGAFTPLVACDLAIAADEATFGLSEVNWGIPPGGVVSKALADTVGSRAALLYIMTGRTFGGREAAEMGLVNSSVPAGRAARRGRGARARAARQEPRRAARGQARLQALPRR